MKVSIHEDNAGALILAKTLSPHSLRAANIMRPRPYGFVKRLTQGGSSSSILILLGFIIGKIKGGETNEKDKRGTQPSQPQHLATPHITSTKQEGTRPNLPPQPVQMEPL